MLLIKSTQKAFNNAVLGFSIKPQWTQKESIIFYTDTKLSVNGKHFFKWRITWKQVSNKKLVKACQNIFQSINKMHLKPG